MFTFFWVLQYIRKNGGVLGYEQTYIYIALKGGGTAAWEHETAIKTGITYAWCGGDKS